MEATHDDPTYAFFAFSFPRLMMVFISDPGVGDFDFSYDVHKTTPPQFDDGSLVNIAYKYILMLGKDVRSHQFYARAQRN
jgi:hypothetical protein